MQSDPFRGEEIIVDCCGSLFYTTKSYKKFLICPLCKEAIFFNEKDLIAHLSSHGMDALKKRHKIPRRHA